MTTASQIINFWRAVAAPESDLCRAALEAEAAAHAETKALIRTEAQRAAYRQRLETWRNKCVTAARRLFPAAVVDSALIQSGLSN